MNLPIINKTPLEIIELNTKAENSLNMTRFMAEVKKLYQYEVFKHMFDLVTTLCMKGRLSFNVYDRRFFELDEGNCRTIEGSSFNKVLNKIKSEKNYVITIKKISADVIVHELAHMLEGEGDFTSIQPFADKISLDLKIHNSNNVSLRAAIKQIMVSEVENYPAAHKISEWFARFFQLVASAKEVAGFGAQYGYNMQEIYQFFDNTVKFLAGDFYNTINSKINFNIATKSKEYIKPLEEIKPKWTETKHNSIHENPNKPAWGRAVKSIKSNPFG
ncbi:hypothetical protein I862_03400 [endosymbiont of Acanthamoeba sp. UWC8]|uniref:WD_0702 family putative metalloprotease n=1 Tax=endosymbiont of Acanthamoeba sp. UWC8 TaxID=86106 RepID=UPI0004D14DCE|nr:hypothetical protein [endosymbiont of Acanthamoeba sp. UWC8]AIF81240.1 hypothetical protein I862_03400 [endosymbiont of Acanthamoeba sp. UWC8]